MAREPDEATAAAALKKAWGLHTELYGLAAELEYNNLDGAAATKAAKCLSALVKEAKKPEADKMAIRLAAQGLDENAVKERLVAMGLA